MRLSRILAAALLLAATPAHAYLDFMLESTGRHYPLGGATYLEAGDSRLLWGGDAQGRPPEEGAAYGYWRPSLGVTYADYYRGARAQVDLFPVAFFGVRGGARLVDNNGDYPAFDCGPGGDRCRGRYTATYAEARLALGAGPWFGAATGKITQMERRDSKRGPFVEPSAGLLLSAQGDRLREINAYLGRSFGPWSAVYNQYYADTRDRAGFTRMHLLSASYRRGSLRFTAGAGAFRSELKPWRPTLAGALTWTPLPSAGLF
jgi:hypothetical protein